MEHCPQSAGKRWFAGICVSILLIAACAGAIHVCGLGFSSPTVHNAAAADTTASHAFCALCNLAHSPSLAGVHFALVPALNAEDHAGALLQAHATLNETFSLHIRPPPAS